MYLLVNTIRQYGRGYSLTKADHPQNLREKFSYLVQFLIQLVQFFRVKFFVIVIVVLIYSGVNSIVVNIYSFPRG